MDYAKTISWEPYMGRDLFKHYASKLSQIKTVGFCTCFTFCWTEYFELYLWICATLILQVTAGLDICNFNIESNGENFIPPPPPQFPEVSLCEFESRLYKDSPSFV